MLKTSRKVVITCAITGALANRKQCPAIPYTPEEIALEAQRAYDQGASIAHIHARNDDGTPTHDPKVFAQIAEQVRKRCPILINFSTGSLQEDTSEQEEMIREVKPDIAALNMGTMNYAKYSSENKSFVFDFVFLNPFSKIKRLLETMNDAGVVPEMECFDSGHTGSITPLLDMDLLKSPMLFSFVVGVLGGIPANMEALLLQRNLVPQGSNWQVIGVGRRQWQLGAASVLLGGNVRVGLEDNFYLPNGAMAGSNGELVKQAAQIIESLSGRIATVAETKEMLRLEP